MRFPRALIPLHRMGFRLFWAGQLVSGLGDLFYAVALPWYVLTHHGGAVELGTVLAAYGITRTVGMIFGGVAADRLRPWNVMMVTDAVRALVLALLTVVAALETAHVAVMVPIALVLGASSGLFMPGAMSMVPSLLPDEELQSGNALTMGSDQLCTLVGPALGGLVVALISPAAGFGVDAATFVVSAVTLAGVRAYQRAAATPSVASASATDDTSDPALGTAQSRLADASDPALVAAESRLVFADAGVAELPSDAGAPELPAGASAPLPAIEPPPAADDRSDLTLLTTLRTERGIQILLLITIAANLGMGAMTEVALPSLVRNVFGSGAGGFGALVAAIGAGGLVGVIASGQVGDLKRPAMTCSYVFLTSAVVIALVPYAGGLIPAAIALMVFGGLVGFGNTPLITLFQRWSPAHLMGQLMSVLMVSSMGMFPVSVLIGGIVVDAHGPKVVFVGAGIILALAVLGGLTQGEFRRFGESPGSAGGGGSEHGLQDTADLVDRDHAAQQALTVDGN